MSTEALMAMRCALEQASDALLGVHGFAPHDNVRITFAWTHIGGALAHLMLLQQQQAHAEAQSASNTPSEDPPGNAKDTTAGVPAKVWEQGQA